MIKRYILTLFLMCTIITFLPHTDVIAATHADSSYEDTVIGQAYDSSTITSSLGLSRANWLANNLTLDWDASETGLYLYLTNVGLDAIDAVCGTITIGGINQPFNCPKVPIGTSSYFVSFPILTCYEEISITFYGIDGGEIFGAAISTGSRAVPATLISTWATGSFPTKESCINYHFAKHGADVGTTNIMDYIRLSNIVRLDIITNGTSAVRQVVGITPNTYRFEWTIYFLHAVAPNGSPTGEIVSFGRKYL